MADECDTVIEKYDKNDIFIVFIFIFMVFQQHVHLKSGKDILHYYTTWN